MNKKFLVSSFVAAFIVLCIIGCSRKEESASADPPAVEEPSTAPSVVAAPTPEPTPSAEEIHRSVVSTAKGNLAILQGTLPVGGEGNNDPMWAGQIKTGNADNSMSVCDLYERHQNGNAVVDALNAKGTDQVSYAELGIDAEALSKIRKDAGLAVAKAFLLALQNMPEESCGRGEGSFSLNDPKEVEEHLVDVLKDVNTEPKNIGSSPEKIRGMLLTDGKKMAQQLAAIEPESSEADDLQQKIANLESEFHFSDAEIGLSQKAAEAVAQKKQ